ncbi:MAG: DNA polymerase thumb domain-containing protein, partial [Clostridia bacterium]
MERIILHADLNNFFASVECLEHKELRDKPLAVAGDAQARHGIILAKNEPAKRCGVTTGAPLWKARQLCPDLICVPPRYDVYMQFSAQTREICQRYTSQVESFGLDECWMDVTGSTALFGNGKTIADALRERIYRELGLTVSVGVSFNKVFAKLGSDMKKPDATTVISRDCFRELLWPLPAETLLFVGRATRERLRQFGLSTIGDLAAADPAFLRRTLGKSGLMLWRFANGLDDEPVAEAASAPPLKSIGNSTTSYRDLITDTDRQAVLYALAETVSHRLRKHGFLCSTVQLSV